MQLFTCPTCAAVVFFENRQCVHCGSELAYDPDAVAFRRLPPSTHSNDNAPARGVARPCGNRMPYDVCNWAVTAPEDQTLCRAYGLNTIIPNLDDPMARVAWKRLEAGKRHLLHTLLGAGLPVEARGAETPDGLAFAFLQNGPTGENATTGHAGGLITINIAEADDSSRETFRAALNEPYRTVLGHFRHESGHYYWDRLIRDGGRRETFRALFGDERADYSEALERHYHTGAPADWATRHLSAYASSHPWEDWAETWAHYLHMVDGVQTARAYGITICPVDSDPRQRSALTLFHACDATFDDLIATWTPVTVALNSFNRGMGFSDLYPFAFSAPVIAKLRYIHETITGLGAA